MDDVYTYRRNRRRGIWFSICLMELNSDMERMCPNLDLGVLCNMIWVFLHVIAKLCFVEWKCLFLWLKLLMQKYRKPTSGQNKRGLPSGLATMVKPLDQIQENVNNYFKCFSSSFKYTISGDDWRVITKKLRMMLEIILWHVLA